METKYLVPQPFKGSISSTVTNGLVDLSGNLHNNGGDDLTVEEYKRVTGKADLVVMTGEELDTEIEHFNQCTYLNAPACRITEEQFIDAFEVLPPAAHTRMGDFERFNMIERLTGTITTQYVRYGNIYLCLNVDAANKDTWVAPADFDKVLTSAVDKRTEAA